MITKSLSDLLHEISQVNHVSSEIGVDYYGEIATHFKRQGYERAFCSGVNYISYCPLSWSGTKW
jgi:hypothetical protein